MSDTQLLRLLLNERLASAAEDIFGLVLQTIAEYQGEVVRSKREIIQLRREIEQLTVLRPEVKLLRDDIESEEASVKHQPAAGEDEERHGDSHWVKEEEEETCIIPDVESSSSEEVRLSDSYSGGRTDCPIFPSFSAVTVTLKDDDDEEWDEGLDSDTCGPSRDGAGEPVEDQQKGCGVPGQPRGSRDSHAMKRSCAMHKEKKEYKCFQCNKQFSRKDHLTVHLRIHTGEKPHKCPSCTKSFAQSSQLTVHLRRHTGEKPYFCESCGKRVAHSTHLKICKNEPKGEKIFRCLICGKKFRTTSDLSLHMRIHEARKL